MAGMPPKRKRRQATKEKTTGIVSGEESNGQELKLPDTKRQMTEIGYREQSSEGGKPPQLKRQLSFSENRIAPTRNYWVLKSEPNSRLVKGVDVSYSLSDLASEEGQVACWDGIRNAESNHNIKSMKVGDLAFFYHSNCREPCLVGLVQIVKAAYPDVTQFDIHSPYYDKRTTPSEPRWFMVDVKFVRKLQRPILLSELRKYHSKHVVTYGPLRDLALVRRTRLSVQRLAKEEYDYIIDNIEPSAAPN